MKLLQNIKNLINDISYINNQIKYLDEKEFEIIDLYFDYNKDKEYVYISNPHLSNSTIDKLIDAGYVIIFYVTKIKTLPITRPRKEIITCIRKDGVVIERFDGETIYRMIYDIDRYNYILEAQRLVDWSILEFEDIKICEEKGDYYHEVNSK